MLVIKRYPNRKLYNTESKRYITLDGIAGLIQEGEEVQILDHTTGEDLTALTLSQIIFEKEKKQSGFLPKNVLNGLVQAGGDTLNSLGRTLASPLGLLADVNKAIENRIQDLIRRGELEESEGVKLLDKLLLRNNNSVEGLSEASETYVKKILAKRGIPSQDELQKLSTQIDELAAKIDSINHNKTGNNNNDKRVG